MSPPALAQHKPDRAPPSAAALGLTQGQVSALELVERAVREHLPYAVVAAQFFDGETEDAGRLDRLFREGWAVVETYPAGETALRLVLRLRD